MKEHKSKRINARLHDLRSYLGVHRLRIVGFLVLFLCFTLLIEHPRPAAAVPPLQEDATPTSEDFFVVPPDNAEQSEEPPLDGEPTQPPTPTEEPIPVVIEQITATPLADLGQVLPEEWRLPLNLSRSGATTNPQMVRDRSGNYHVLWRDALDGYVYTTGREESWTSPIAPELPFTTRRYFPDLDSRQATPSFAPTLAADNAGNIHAFWIDNSGSDDVLYHSSVPAGNFSDLNAWTERQSLDNAARKVAWSAGDGGILHVAYIRPAESARRPSGIYYRRFDPGSGWSNPVLLYSSRYLRGVEADQANVQILADGPDLFVVWDDTLREQIYFTSSADSGRSWQTPQEIDRRSREDSEDAAGPNHITVGQDGETLLLTWRGGHELGQTCSQYVSSSTDFGETWSLRSTLDELSGCLDTAQFITNDQGFFLLGSATQQGANRQEVNRNTYLLAWDGGRWSDPQVQDPLTLFSNPDTFQPVELSCLNGMGDGDAVEFLGCDTGNGQDIWLLAREMGVVDDWFPPPSIWVGPEDAGPSVIKAEDLQLVVDDQGGAHAFWYNSQGSEIYHTIWNGQSWSSPRPILNTPNGRVEQLASASANGRLYLVWRDSSSGLHFSRAEADRSSEWSSPQLLVEDATSAVAPSIFAASDGRILISYALPLNEERGIYLLQSGDAGDSWSAHRRVFDGSAAGWQMVDSPLITTTANGQYHLMWTHRSLPPDSRPLALVYSHSEDKGETWSEVETVTENPIVWSHLEGVAEYIVHRFWAEESSDRLAIWHEVSMDGGLSWGDAVQVTGLSGDADPAVAVDVGNDPHLLAIDDGRLKDMIWNEERWTASDDLTVPFSAGGQLAAAGDRQIQLLVLHSGRIPGTNDDEESPGDLYFMWRPFDIPPEQMAPLPTLTPTPQPTATPEPTATPQPTPTIAFTSEQDNDFISQLPKLPVGKDASASLILLAILPAALIVLLGFLVGIRVLRKR
ncbi:MAG: sialidase family protein [Candidatus Promineifilaceae bacterium]